jgi:hypothetical protein
MCAEKIFFSSINHRLICHRCSCWQAAGKIDEQKKAGHA